MYKMQSRIMSFLLALVINIEVAKTNTSFLGPFCLVESTSKNNSFSI